MGRETRHAARKGGVILLAALAAAGCGANGESSADGRPTVLATTTQVGDFVRQVGGDRVRVHQILAPNADPHGYEPRPSDARASEEAFIVFRSGGDLDGWLADLVPGDEKSVELADFVDGEPDPHWWQDPRRASRAVEVIRAALTERDPDGRAEYARNASRYRERLHALDRRVAACIAKLPPARRKLVTTHDALGFYAKRYGLEVVGALIPSLSSQAQPSSKDIGELVDQIRDEGVKAIFPERSLGSKLERAVSRESGAAVGGRLWADTLGPEGSSGETYVKSIVSNTETIVKGLSGGTVSCRP